MHIPLQTALIIVHRSQTYVSHTTRLQAFSTKSLKKFAPSGYRSQHKSGTILVKTFYLRATPYFGICHFFLRYWEPPQCPSRGCPQFLDTFFHSQLALFFNVTISSFISCLGLHSSLSSFAKLVSILNDFPLICDPCYAHRILGSPGGRQTLRVATKKCMA